MGKKKRIKALEDRIEQLEIRIASLESHQLWWTYTEGTIRVPDSSLTITVPMPDENGTSTPLPTSVARYIC